MTVSPIKFGTDGWRAIIGREYTEANVARVASATADWVRSENPQEPKIVIGYDTRFGGELFAKVASIILAKKGLKVLFGKGVTPTPAVSLAAKKYNAEGVVITASHNPPDYNGFKLKARFGGPATPVQVKEVEKQIPDYVEVPPQHQFDELIEAGTISMIDFTNEYLSEIEKSISLDAIKNWGGRIAHDAMFGATSGLLKRLLGDQVTELHVELNPGFNGRAPEPIDKNLPEMPNLIREEKCALGIANDGDGDRIGMFDEQGNFVDSHKLLSLLFKYLSQEKGENGMMVKTFSTTDMLDKQAQKYGYPIKTTPIGFKYIVEEILENDVLVCGEESGGIAVKGHIPERDGLYTGLLIAEMLAAKKATLSDLVNELQIEFGEHHYYRDDLHTSNEKKDAFVTSCKNSELKEIAGYRVMKHEFTDGIKHRLEDGSWLLVRPSGTEPVLRIYSEASNQERAKENVEWVSSFIDTSFN